MSGARGGDWARTAVSVAPSSASAITKREKILPLTSKDLCGDCKTYHDVDDASIEGAWLRKLLVAVARMSWLPHEARAKALLQPHFQCHCRTQSDFGRSGR